MKHLLCTAAVCLGLAAVPQSARISADPWFEISSPSFRFWAEANDGATRTLVWQLEQIRHVAKSLWPWLKVDLPKSLVVLAVKDEPAMRMLAPQYWEVKDGVRPASVWVSAPDQHYLAIRTNIRIRDDVMVNPHITAYFSYASLVFSSSFTKRQPPWLQHGLASVLSNTLVRQDDVVVGAAIPWHLETLRGKRVPLRQLLTVTSSSLQTGKADDRRYFDAQSWAFVHYLMFGDEGARAAKLNAFVASLERGDPADAAFAAAIGAIDDHEQTFMTYVHRNLYSAVRIKADLSVDRDRFPARQMSLSESAVAKACFHVAMRRPAEARALIDEAAKADPASPGPVVAEALMLDHGGNRDAARIAYTRGIELGTTNAYALYRAAILSRRGADARAMVQVEKNLAKAVEVSPSFAAAHAALAEVRADLQRPQSTIVSHMHKAVALEPANPWHRLAAARVLARLNAPEEARKAAQSALERASEDASVRTEAERILALLKATGGSHQP
jgi:tetratricopeptide (TPR) repeat protein